MDTESKYLAAKVRYEKLAKSPKSVNSPGAKNKAWRTMRRLQKELEANRDLEAQQDAVTKMLKERNRRH